MYLLGKLFEIEVTAINYDVNFFLSRNAIFVII